MTEQNYQYRTSQNLLRNQFDGDGPFQIPIIPKASFSEKEFQELMLIGFDKARADDEKNRDRMVHFFLYDYKFERVWKDALLFPWIFGVFVHNTRTQINYLLFRQLCFD